MAYGGLKTNYSSQCLTSSRFTMSATVLHQDGDYEISPDNYGTWVRSQDPLTGSIVREWKVGTDNPATPEVEVFTDVACLARGIVDGGIRVAGTTERFGDMYENIDFVKLWLPANVRVTKRDRVTNIKDSTGQIKWLDEEFNPTNPKATVFNVNGVTPLFNAFNAMVEQFVLLERAQVSTDL